MMELGHGAGLELSPAAMFDRVQRYMRHWRLKPDKESVYHPYRAQTRTFLVGARSCRALPERAQHDCAPTVAAISR